MTQRFCKDCRHFKPGKPYRWWSVLAAGPGRVITPFSDLCASPRRGRSLISGEQYPLRADDARFPGNCGPEAKWFEPKAVA